MKLKNIILSLSILSSVTCAQATQFYGVDFPDQIRVESQNMPLKGAGLRKMLIIKAYALGLYSQDEINSSNILSLTKPQAIRLVLLRSIKSSQLAHALKDGIEKNQPESEQLKIKPSLDEMLRQFDTYPEIEQGSVIDVAYNPQTGVSVFVNGFKIFVMKDHPIEFYHALMSIWFGSNPVDNTLKEQVLKGIQK